MEAQRTCSCGAVDRSGYLRDRNGHQTLRRRPRRESSRSNSYPVLAVAQVQEDNFDTLLGKFTLRRTLGVCAWIGRFIHNARSTHSNRNKGPQQEKSVNKESLGGRESKKASRKTNGLKNIGCSLIFNQMKMGCLSVEGGSKVYSPFTCQNCTSLRSSLLKKSTTARCMGE